MEAGRAEELFEASLIKRVDVSPRGIVGSAGVAGGFSEAKVLAERNADENAAFSDANDFAAGGFEARGGDVFENFGTDDEVEIAFAELKVCGVALDLADSGVVDAGFFEVERRDFGEAFGKQLRDVTIASADIEDGTAEVQGQERQEAVDSSLFPGRLAIGYQVDGVQAPIPSIFTDAVPAQLNTMAGEKRLLFFRLLGG